LVDDHQVEAVFCPTARSASQSLGSAVPVVVRFVVRSFSTNSRPALRAAACGGRPRRQRRDGYRRADRALARGFTYKN
jgi:hypothetical protein